MKLNNKHLLIYNKDMMSLMYAVRMVVLLNVIRYLSNGNVLSSCRLHPIIMTKCDRLRNNYLRLLVVNARRHRKLRRRLRVPIVLACDHANNVNWLDKTRTTYYNSVYNYYGLKEEDKSVIETVVGLFI